MTLHNVLYSFDFQFTIHMADKRTVSWYNIEVKYLSNILDSYFYFYMQYIPMAQIYFHNIYVTGVFQMYPLT